LAPRLGPFRVKWRYRAVWEASGEIAKRAAEAGSGEASPGLPETTKRRRWAASGFRGRERAWPIPRTRASGQRQSDTGVGLPINVDYFELHKMGLRRYDWRALSYRLNLSWPAFSGPMLGWNCSSTRCSPAFTCCSRRDRQCRAGLVFRRVFLQPGDAGTVAMARCPRPLRTCDRQLRNHLRRRASPPC